MLDIEQKSEGQQRCRVNNNRIGSGLTQYKLTLGEEPTPVVGGHVQLTEPAIS